MKFSIVLSLILLFTACQQHKKEVLEEEDDSSTNFYVGTYTDGDSQGIYKYTLQKDGTLEKIGLVARTENPSFLTKSKDDKFLISVNEISNKDTVGAVSSFLIDNDSLLFINKTSSGGAHPCHVTINKLGYILVANYTGGNTGLLKLNKKGALSGLLDIKQHNGNGIHKRQEAPHVHSVWFLPDSDEIISVDLGTNELWFSKLDTTVQKLQTTHQQKLKMDDNAGPRHLSIHPNGKWIYVLNELNATITLVEQNTEGDYIKKNTITILPTDFKDSNTSADIHISWNGKFVYASNRGHNSIAILKTNDLDGSLSLVGHETKNIDTPRNFSLSPDEKYLLVANQNSNSIVSFKRDTKTGLLEFIDEIEAPTPVCILF